MVRVTAQGRGDDTQLVVESRSKMSLTLVDWGKNKLNVETVLAGL